MCAEAIVELDLERSLYTKVIAEQVQLLRAVTVSTACDVSVKRSCAGRVKLFCAVTVSSSCAVTVKR
jgi:hypothetical protein